ncbi:MAG: alkyl sulfatase dimerization domain-containing protein [Myxococcota bacterium]|nr:alkyl sulfatase dimerization domain-containing protein [Myxococcota bacterium]
MRTPLYKSRPVAPYPPTEGIERINDFILLSEGLSNSYMIETSEGNIQINAGMFFEAPIHKANYEAVAQQPTRYLVVTQGHVDHVGGTAFLRKEWPGLQLIATSGNAEHQAYDGRLGRFRAERSGFAFAQTLAKTIASSNEKHGPLPAQDAPTPDIVFDNHYAMELGGLRIELIAVPGAETNDSLIVWLPDHKICFTGNLFGCPFGHFPNLITIRGDRYRDALVCAEAVETVKALEPEMILYGHHAPVIGRELIQEELACLKGAILFVHDAVVEGMNEGKDVHTLMQEIELPSELEVGQGYGKVSWSIRAIWENYAGWFHHASTSELYSVPHSAIHADLIDMAGGPAAIVARAREKLAAGELEQAVHLLDTVLSEGNHPDAIDAMVETHERLLEASENFWLSAWLGNQISLLKARRA